MTIGPQTLCSTCKRFRPGFERGGQPSCSAFPDGVPERILVGGFDHRHPFPGDGGQRYVQRDDTRLPPGYPEKVAPQSPVLIHRPETPIRHQTKKELRETAKALIEGVRQSGQS